MAMKRREFLRLTGLAAGAVAVNGLNLGAASGTLTTSGWTGGDAFDALAEELRIGDVLTFAGRYAVNPVTRAATPHLQHFMVIAMTDNTIDFIPKPQPALTRADRLTPLGGRRPRTRA